MLWNTSEQQPSSAAVQRKLISATIHDLIPFSYLWLFLSFCLDESTNSLSAKYVKIKPNMTWTMSWNYNMRICLIINMTFDPVCQSSEHPSKSSISHDDKEKMMTGENRFFFFPLSPPHISPTTGQNPHRTFWLKLIDLLLTLNTGQYIHKHYKEYLWGDKNVKCSF